MVIARENPHSFHIASESRCAQDLATDLQMGNSCETVFCPAAKRVRVACPPLARVGRRHRRVDIDRADAGRGDRLRPRQSGDESQEGAAAGRRVRGSGFNVPSSMFRVQSSE